MSKFSTPLVAQGSIAKVDMEMYCDKCDKSLMDVKAGGYTFSSANCDCSWRCCEHSTTNIVKNGYSYHKSHLKYRPKCK